MLQRALAWVPAAGVVGPVGVGVAVTPQRAEAAALLEALNATLLRHRSATRALERWCRAHGTAPDSPILAQRLTGLAQTPSAGRRRRLAVGPDEPVRHRRVRLACAGRLLSEADNWYVPGRLAPAANRALEDSDTPFGRAIGDLPVRRRVLAVERLWAPTLGAPPPWVLRHHALLIGADGMPISEVLETYAREALFLDGGPP